MSSQTDEPIEAVMARRHDDFVRRFNAGDADGIADTFYAPDAVILPPHGPRIEGRAAIRAFLREFHRAACRTGTITLTRVEASGDLAYVVGAYAVEACLPDGTTASDTGHLLEAWCRDAAGDWWCVADMYASDRPPE